MAHYTRRQKLKALKLLEKGHSKRKVIRMLGYPSLAALKNWARELAKTGDVRNVSSGRPPKYTPEQRKAALRAFKRNDGAFKATCRQLGYPSVELLRRWVRAAAPRKGGIIGTPVKYRNTPHPEIPESKRREAVQKMVDPETNVSQLAADLEVSRTTLYIWRSRYGRGRAPRKSMKESQTLQNKVAELAADKTLSAEERLDAALKRVAELDSLVNRLGQESEQLQKDIYQLRLEKDALVQTALLLKKGEGVDPKSLSNRAKTLAIDALRATYPLKDLCAVFDLAKSSYCYQKKALERPDKYAGLKQSIKAEFEGAFNCYGYRRIWHQLKQKTITVSEKVVRRLMKDLGLSVWRPKARKYSSYVGEVSPEVPNLVERDFHADKPNVKWLTDITEFSIGAGKVYLSPVIDCYDGMPVAWRIGTSPSAELANSMLQSAVATLKPGERPTIHSDRGGHYRWPKWIELVKKAGLVRSMSKKGCSPDNSACEGFFGTIKCEMFYGRDWSDVSIEDFMARLDKYLNWFRETRIKMRLGGVSPMTYRLQNNPA